jgi:uncharacterized protein (DUF2141 family)
MKTTFLTLALIFSATLLHAQNTLSIEITELKTNSGTVYVNLLSENQKSFQKIKGSVSNNTCTVMLSEIPNGTYAVTYYHDENDNGKLDTGMFGKPEEGYGYSNDARGFMGPADFEDQVFEIKSDLQITLKTVN